MLLSLSTVTIVRAALGKGSAQKKKKMFEYLSGFNVVDMFPSWSFVGGISGLRRGMEHVHKEMDGVLNEIIEEHEGKKLDGDDMNEDLVDVLLRIKRNGEMDLSQTMEKCQICHIILIRCEHSSKLSCDLFIGGSNTSSAAIMWAMTELIPHPMVMQKAQLEVRKVLNGMRIFEEGDINKLPYLNQVIKETLRLHPIAPLVPRLCRETVELAGYTIPVKS
ncbi:hypothetical protein IEQ34_006503 [Dendrobium chrysotoxum]|uniref:Cytochrome P450 n=1 Tax=Dendrobium chrysotoxum TaxID=161865 RepID=A0AAV7H5R3_DENCH|nr:hypothetical protein IEQ34_006503 [Dendrobium chrysotoxum]